MTAPTGSGSGEHRAMVHPRIDDERVVDRYLAGRLDAEDTARFEEHLFACDACLAAVEAGEQLRRGLQAVAAETMVAAETVLAAETVAAADSAHARGLIALGVLAWLRRRPGMLAAVTLLVVLLPAALVWQQLELQRLRSAAERPAFDQPTADLQLVPLGVVRDAGPTLLQIDAERPLVLLSLELPSTGARLETYRVELRGGASMDDLVWRAEGLEPTLYDSLLIALPARSLVPGDYRIVVGAETAAGGDADEQVLELRVVDSPGS
ncbi:MAG: zf-HC2 domain-containing protein [Acidobacteriota bacterium]